MSSVGLNSPVIERGVRGIFARAFATKHRTLWYPKVTTILDSNQEEEKFVALGTVPTLKEHFDEREVARFNEFEYTVKQTEYSNMIALKRKTFDFDQTGQLRTFFNSLGGRVANFPQKLICDLLKNGLSDTCYDGLPFIDEDHDIGGGQDTQANIIAPSVINGEALVDFNGNTMDTNVKNYASCLSEAITQMSGFVDDHGEPWHTDLSPETLKIICGPRVAPILRGVVSGAEFPGGGTNPMASTVGEVISTPLNIGNQDSGNTTTNGSGTESTSFYLIKVSSEMNPFIFLRFRPKMASEMKDPLAGLDEEIVDAMQAVELQSVQRTGNAISSHTMKKGEFLYGARAIFAAAYGMWQNCVKVAPDVS